MYKKSVIVEYSGKKYEIPYPTVGQQLEIENLRNLLSGGTYRELARIASKSANDLLNVIDGFSVLCVMLPELKLKPENFNNLDILQSTEISNCWFKIFDFQNEVRSEINKIMSQTEDDKKEG